MEVKKTFPTPVGWVGVVGVRLEVIVTIVSKLDYYLLKGLATYLYRGYNPVTKYHGHPSFSFFFDHVTLGILRVSRRGSGLFQDPSPNPLALLKTWRFGGLLGLAKEKKILKIEDL